MNKEAVIEADRFSGFVAIDWSGAKGDRHKGIALAICDADTLAPRLIEPGRSSWSRRAIVDWLLDHRNDNLLIGFDFSFSAPFVARGAHLPGEAVTPDAKALWAHVDTHSDDIDLGASSFVEARRGLHFYLGAADGPKSQFMHFRACESLFNERGGGKPSTVYDAIGAAQVSKASFSGMRLLHHLDVRIPVWPFDPVPSSGPVIVEIYTAIAARAAGLRKGVSKLRNPAALDAALAALGSGPHSLLPRYNDHMTDAILASAWLRANGHRAELWQPNAMDRRIADTEGWTFGIS